MTHLLTRTALLAVVAAALTACQTAPAYPTREGYVRPPPPTPMTPAYPTSRSDPAGLDAAGGRAEAPPPAVSPSPTAAIESAPLPPPSAAAPPPPAAAPPPPAPVRATYAQAADVPPPMAPAQPEPASPPAYTPPPEASPPPAPAPRPPPPPRPRPVPTRLVATGRVMTVDGGLRTYVVQPGDHVDALARQFDTTRRQIVRDNDLEEPYRLHPGDRLRVPAPPAQVYVVSSGDTLAAIARRFSVRVDSLRALNSSAARSLRPGSRLTLPGNIRDIGPQRIPAPDLAVAQAPRPPRPRAVPPTASTPSPPPSAMASNAAPPPSPPPVRAAPPPTPAPLARPPSSPPPVARPPAPPVYTPPPPAVAAPPPPAVRGAPPVVQSSPPVADSQIASMGRGRFQWPIQGSILSTFGPKPGGRRNDGVDIQGTDGTSVRAAAAGEVVYAGDQVPGFGNLVLLKHADGWVTAYAHLGRVDVQMRQRVSQGQSIGTVGTSGGVAEPQLHFEVRYAPTPADRARPIDPALVLPGGR